MAVREQWLEKRPQMILPMMRRFVIDMWIVVNEEFHDDPLTQYIAPARPYAAGRDMFVFVDSGEKGLRKIAINGIRRTESEARLRVAGRTSARRQSAP